MPSAVDKKLRSLKFRMQFAPKLGVYVSIALLIFGLFNASFVEAKSVFAITDHGLGSNNDMISAYLIQDDQLVLQCHHEPADHGTGYGFGPVGLAIDPDSGYLFVTYESLGGIELILTKSMTNELFVPVPGASNLAGIVFDTSQQKVYAMERQMDKFFVFHWNPLEPSLIPDTTAPSTLSHTPNAGGLALDEIEGLLYVTRIGGSVGHSAVSHIVDYYETQNWTYQGSVEILVDGNPRNAMGITAYNSGDGARYLYTGGYSFTNSHNYLVRTDLNTSDPNNAVEYDVGTMVIGLAADQETHLVYATLDNDSVVVFNPNDWPPVITDVETDSVSGPADICIGNVDYKPSLFYLDKNADDTEPNYCVAPSDNIIYTICYSPDEGVHSNVAITDFLPAQVDFVRAEPNDGYYDDEYHIYTWYLGEVVGSGPEEPNVCLELEVEVNSGANPLGEIINYVELESDASFSFAQKSSPVCCWDQGIIYVNDDAQGANNGTSWENAYTNLQDALERARQECGSEIWVAEGTYKPSDTLVSTAAFELISQVALYGGFLGNETARNQRLYYENQTILSGEIDPAGANNSDSVVLAQNVDETAVLDGFIIRGAVSQAVRCESAHPLITNCIITDNGAKGLDCSVSGPVLTNCIIKNHSSDGIYADGSSSPTIANSKIYHNAGNGIYCRYTWPTIINSWIHHNGAEGVGAGLYFENSSASVTVRNNTIAYNAGVGVVRIGGGDVIVSNCILWGNDSEGDDTQLLNCSAGYSCIYDSEDPGGSCVPDVYNNITCNPQFLYNDSLPDDFHLDPNSPCIDLGNPALDYSGETDIDGELRKIADNVDMGADEFGCEDVSSEIDFNHDAIVNQLDYRDLAWAWLCTPIDDNWNPLCDLDNNDIINVVDLELFAQQWLWQPCWTDVGN